ncbi:MULTISPECIES: hypothetical protein [Enorma]|uniref:hypothetical protein n=1 Tax=Enorma TaxID=1472762 RepID=UPI000379D69F|nr:MULTISPECIES: hypothetical protein [Enorma]
MAHLKNFFPNLFMKSVSVSATRPPWFVLLLAAMATAAVWAGAWVLLMLLLQQATEADAGNALQPGMFIAMFFLFWALAVPWYHIIYLWSLRTTHGNETPDTTETHWEVWGSLPFMIVLMLIKVFWLVIKYVFAPFLPLLIADSLRMVPTFGNALANTAIVLVAAYPLIALAVYAVWKHRATKEAFHTR